MHSWIHRFLALALLTASLTAFATVLQPIPGSPGPNTGESSLFRDAGGTLHLTWSGPGVVPAERALWHATLTPTADAWSIPHAIVSTPLLMENWADFATLTVATDGTLWAQWYQSRPAEERGYDGWFARSTDGGDSWTKPIPLGHEFVSLAPLSGGRVMAVWLESARPPRPPGQPRAPKDPNAPYAPSMRLVARLLAPNGTRLRDWVIDSDTCTCCQTTLAAQPNDQLLVAYRGHTANEIRDNHVACFDGANWLPPSVLHDDVWQIPACPVNGPAADTVGSTVAVAWFTAAQGIPRVQAKFSTDNGGTFGPPIPVDLDRPIGRIDLITLPDHSAVVSWLESASEANQAGLHVRRLYVDGTVSDALNLGATSATRASGFARMAVRDPSTAEIVITYTEVDPDLLTADGAPTTQIRTATFSADGLRPSPHSSPKPNPPPPSISSLRPTSAPSSDHHH